MKTASQDLINEHKTILTGLNVIEKMSERARKGEEIDYKDIEEIIEFLKVFADKCHHGKEEGFLFPALEKAGVRNQNGPIGVMLAQHKQGRELIIQMQGSVVNKIINKNTFSGAASSYVNLLRNHIEKEDTILFPMSDKILSSTIQKELSDDFENLEKDVITEGKYEEFHILLEKLKKKYL